MFYCTLKGKEFAHINLEKVENPRGVSGSGNGDAAGPTLIGVCCFGAARAVATVRLPEN